MTDARGVLVHLPQRVRVGLEPELRDEAEAADEAQRILLEARRAHGSQHARTEVPLAAERVDERSVGEPARHRVHREVAASEILLDGDGRVGDDLEVVAAGARRALDPRRRELDARGRQAPRLRVVRVETNADEPPGDVEVLDAAVRSERRA